MACVFRVEFILDFHLEATTATTTFKNNHNNNSNIVNNKHALRQSRPPFHTTLLRFASGAGMAFTHM
eukprot:m.22807 g.22807  ORF g.22807 m.22807 type:complete len:67 (+) comp8371_c0_seq1:433-633(+)